MTAGCTIIHPQHEDVKTPAIFLTIALAITQNGCGDGPPTTLPQIPTVTRVDVVSDQGGLTIKTIHDPAQVKLIENFFNQNRKDWHEAFLGIVPGGLTVALYNGTNCCAMYGVAENCLVSGSLINRSMQQRAELLRLIGDLPKNLSEVVLPGISNITEIVVMTNTMTDGMVGRITNAQTISQVVNLVNRHQTGWETNWYGQPTPDVVLKLRNKDGFVVEFCAGAGFLVRGEDEEYINIMLKHVKKQESDEILNLVRVDEPSL